MICSICVLEQPPFQADLAAKQATVQQMQAQLANATIAFTRASSLLKTPAGQQSTVDDARAAMLSDAAQVQNAEALARQSQINLDYTEIHAPINGKIGRTSVTIGNVVSPSMGVLATIVSQDPMHWCSLLRCGRRWICAITTRTRAGSTRW